MSALESPVAIDDAIDVSRDPVSRRLDALRLARALGLDVETFERAVGVSPAIVGYPADAPAYQGQMTRIVTIVRAIAPLVGFSIAGVRRWLCARDERLGGRPIDCLCEGRIDRVESLIGITTDV